MKPARIVLLAVALVAGLLAAFLVMRGGGNSGTPGTRTVVTEVTREEQRTQILVAKAAIGIGERLSPATVEWVDWPAGAVRSEYVSIEAMPDAPQQLTGTVARFEFFAGEPIREQKLVHAEQGYLSAVLSSGMRGVSVPVTPESGAGGYVVPNDRVDVILSRVTPAGRIAEVVVANVRVLAIGNRLGELGASAGRDGSEDAEAGPQAQVFTADTVATLELSPVQSEAVINSAQIGELSLALRSIIDFNEDPVATRRDGASQAVRIIRYGVETNVMSGQSAMPGDQGAATAMPGALEAGGETVAIEVAPQFGAAQSGTPAELPQLQIQ